MSCNLEALRSFGYSVIRLPRADVAPLQLLAKRGGTLDRIGDLATVILPGDSVPLPPIRKDTPAANLSGSYRRFELTAHGSAFEKTPELLSEGPFEVARRVTPERRSLEDWEELRYERLAGEC
jgi:hypothetical protein